MQRASIQRGRGVVLERRWWRARARLGWIWRGWVLTRMVVKAESGASVSWVLLREMVWVRVERSGWGRSQV